MTQDFVTEVETALAIPEDVSMAERKLIVKDLVSQLSIVDDVVHVYSARLLWEIKQGQYYADWNYPNFQSFADAELQFSARKAYDLVKVYEKYHVELGMTPEEIRQYVWSKLVVLARVIDETNMDELLEKAKVLSVEALKDMVSAMKSGEKEVFEKLNFMLTTEQKETILNALEVASEISGSEKKGNNLELICAEFLSTKIDDAAKNIYTSLELIVNMLERVYGVKFTVTKDATQNEETDDTAIKEVG